MSPDLTQVVGIVAGIFTAISLLPQLLKIIRNKKADDISLFYLIILLCGLSLWVWYGVLRDDIPIIATNSFSLLLNVAIMILGVRYKKRSNSSK